MSSRGYFGVGISHGKVAANLGTLWRSAHVFGASFLFTIGGRYRQQSSDTTKAWRHVPLWHFSSLDECIACAPLGCQVIGVELTAAAMTLSAFAHPERCIYLLGGEDCGLSAQELAQCHGVVQLPGRFCLNVAVAGSIVLHDRVSRLRQEAA